jgi:hypothetical protein
VVRWLVHLPRLRCEVASVRTMRPNAVVAAIGKVWAAMRRELAAMPRAWAAMRMRTPQASRGTHSPTYRAPHTCSGSARTKMISGAH